MLNCRSGFHRNYEDPKVSNLERSKEVSEISVFLRSVSCAHCWLFLHHVSAQPANQGDKEAVSLSFVNCLQFQRECEAPAELDA